MDKIKDFSVSVFKKDKPVLNILMAIGISAAAIVGLKIIFNAMTPEQPEEENNSSNNQSE